MIAERLGKSISEAKSSISATEFIRWQLRFEREVNEFHREDWFLAQIAYHVYLIPYRIFGGKADLELKDFLMKFTVEGKRESSPSDTPRELTDTERQAVQMKADASRAAWLGFAGLKQDGSSVKRKDRAKRHKPKQHGPVQPSKSVASGTPGSHKSPNAPKKKASLRKPEKK